MKKKNDSSETLTKGFFRKELKKALTKYPTKRDLQREMGTLESRMDAKMDFKFDGFRHEIAQMFVTFKSDIFDKLDAFVKEVRDSHEERAVVGNQVSELRDRVDEHEERIAKLETAKIAA